MDRLYREGYVCIVFVNKCYKMVDGVGAKDVRWCYNFLIDDSYEELKFRRGGVLDDTVFNLRALLSVRECVGCIGVFVYVCISYIVNEVCC